MKPWGRWHANDMYRGRRRRARRARAEEGGPRCTTARRRSTAGRSARSPTPRSRPRGRTVVVPIETPLKTRGGVADPLRQPRPEGCAVKLAGHDRTLHRGPARVFDSEEETLRGGQGRQDRGRRRRRDPLRGPARRARDARDAPRHRGDRRRGPLATRSRSITDGRFSGATHGFMVGHVAPEASKGGPLAALREGDIVVIDVERAELNVELVRGRDRGAARRLGRAGAALPPRRARELRDARLVGLGGRGDALAVRDRLGSLAGRLRLLLYFVK